MTKQMESPVDKFKPMKEADYKKLTPAQKKAYDAKAKKATMGNLPSAADKARQAKLDEEFGTYNKMPDTPKKKMMCGGKVDKPKRGQRAAKNKMMAGGMAKSKVRGYGMARGGKVCKMR
jgi:hypothetical protein